MRFPNTVAEGTAGYANVLSPSAWDDESVPCSNCASRLHRTWSLGRLDPVSPFAAATGRGSEVGVVVGDVGHEAVNECF